MFAHSCIDEPTDTITIKIRSCNVYVHTYIYMFDLLLSCVLLLELHLSFDLEVHVTKQFRAGSKESCITLFGRTGIRTGTATVQHSA